MKVGDYFFVSRSDTKNNLQPYIYRIKRFGRGDAPHRPGYGIVLRGPQRATGFLRACCRIARTLSPLSPFRVIDNFHFQRTLFIVYAGNILETAMLKNITLSAEEALIEKARQRAQAESTTLNAEFRNWLAQYAQRPQTHPIFGL
jgi:hypothetical protein